MSKLNPLELVSVETHEIAIQQIHQTVDRVETKLDTLADKLEDTNVKLAEMSGYSKFARNLFLAIAGGVGFDLLFHLVSLLK